MISLRDVVTDFGNRDPLAEVWRRSLRGGGGGKISEISGVPPMRYIGNGKPLTDYMIYGNTIQNGTPTPEATVDAVGCGVWDETRQSYKLPLTVNGAEHPIYLGQVETTRRIKKLVLTGEELWSRHDASGVLSTSIANPLWASFQTGVSSHWPFEQNRAVYIQLTEGHGCIRNGGYNALWIRDKSFSSVDDFKSYLAAQYANGTPVTVWYVLAEPETGIVNEPLMKIGDYADTVSFAQAGVTIPTVNGENILDVSADVKPSQITIKGGISSV